MLFSEDERDAELRRHLAEGGKGVFVRGREIIQAEGVRETPLAPLPNGEPAAVVLAAVAAVVALGLTVEDVAAGLKDA